jgi:hypothetical protein
MFDLRGAEMEWIRRYVVGLRADLGIAGAPTELDLLRCLELFSSIRLQHAEVETAFCTSLPSGGALITLPRALRGREWERTVSHELGHARFTCGMYRLLRQMGADDPRLLRLARLWQWKEERIASTFAAAWLLES